MDRNQVIGKYIRPFEAVWDLGAGSQNLSRFIPKSCTYVPIDCVAIHRNSFVIDFNQEFDLPDEPVDVIVASGFFEYIVDLDNFLSKLMQNIPHKPIYFSYAFAPQTDQGRKRNGWLNNLGNMENSIEYFSIHLRDVRPLTIWQSHQVICCGVL